MSIRAIGAGHARRVRRAARRSASLLGTGVGLLGFTALLVYLASERSPGIPVTAYGATILGNIALVALFGVAAFAQPAIGAAFLAGPHDVIGLNSSVYGTALTVTSVVGIVLFCAGAVLFAVAIARSPSLPRNAGILFAASVPIFAIGSIMGNALALIGALGEVGSAIWIARSASRHSDPRSQAAASDQEPPVLAAHG